MIEWSFDGFIYYLFTLHDAVMHSGVDMIRLIPLVIMLELPISLIAISGLIHWAFEHKKNLNRPLKIQPKVSCIITCYGEGDDILKTVITLAEQTYKGHIEIIPVVDGAIQNKDTFEAAKKAEELIKRYPNRSVKVIPKWQRGGRVSTLNAGLAYASGEIIMNADGDTSFDNNMIIEVLKVFEDPNVPAAGGSLRVRNYKDGIATRMQNIEYMISIQGNKTGLAEWNLINNISGAFGIFRADFLRQIGAWDTHTAEDLDLTVRMKQYFGRHKEMRLPFVPLAIGHTDVPANFKELFQQRLRWDGDLAFLYLRKHRYAFNPRLVGWKTLIFTSIYGTWQNIVLPALIILFNIYIIINMDINFISAIFAAQIGLYFLYALIHYALFLILVSERPKQDAAALPWVLLYPIYGLTMRTFSAFATINEFIRRGHEESNMAPWWVLSKGKRF